MNKKLNKLTSQFPNIFRFIPEDKLFKEILKSKFLLNYLFACSVLFSLVLIFGVIVFGFRLSASLGMLKHVISERQVLKSKLNFWESITQQYEGYKDAYFQIAVLEYKLGDLDKARLANNKTLLLDPNFEDAKKMETLINK